MEYVPQMHPSLAVDLFPSQPTEDNPLGRGESAAPRGQAPFVDRSNPRLSEERVGTMGIT